MAVGVALHRAAVSVCSSFTLRNHFVYIGAAVTDVTYRIDRF